MRCPKCQTANTDTARFCRGCGASLTPQDGPFPSFTRTLETPPQPLVRGAVFAERYEIIEELGHGGMGSVFRVEDKKTIDRFRNELITARKIRHKNVCGMYDLGEYQDN